MISIDGATAVFADCYANSRSLTSPAQSIVVGKLLVVRDLPGHRRYARNEEIVVPTNTAAAHILDQLQTYRPSRGYIVCVMRKPDDDMKSTIAKMKSTGFRFLRTEPLMARGTRPPIFASTPYRVHRATTEAEAELVRVLTRHRLLAPTDIGSLHPRSRLYYAEHQGKAIGWTRSVSHPTGAAYVSGMYTSPGFRRQGIGTALLSTMFADECAVGIEISVLLASKAGAALYQSVGYETIGKMLVFSPTKR